MGTIPSKCCQRRQATQADEHEVLQAPSSLTGTPIPCAPHGTWQFSPGMTHIWISMFWKLAKFNFGFCFESTEVLYLKNKYFSGSRMTRQRIQTPQEQRPPFGDATAHTSGWDPLQRQLCRNDLARWWCRHHRGCDGWIDQGSRLQCWASDMTQRSLEWALQR